MPDRLVRTTPLDPAVFRSLAFEKELSTVVVPAERRAGRQAPVTAGAA